MKFKKIIMLFWVHLLLCFDGASQSSSTITLEQSSSSAVSSETISRCAETEFPCGDDCYPDTDYYRGQYWDCDGSCLSTSEQCHGQCPDDKFSCGRTECYPDTDYYRGRYWDCDDSCIRTYQQCNYTCPPQHFRCCAGCEPDDSTSKWMCGGDCIETTTQCESECPAGFFKCGDKCREDTESNRESYRTCGTQCLYEDTHCNGSCPPDRYYSCDSSGLHSCTQDSRSDYTWDCDGSCIGTNEQCEGKCPTDYFICENECKRNTTYNRDQYRFCADQCLYRDQQCNGTCPDNMNVCGGSCRDKYYYVEDRCGASCFYFNNLTGGLTHKKDPGGYSNYHDCHLTLTAPENYIVLIEFEEFQIYSYNFVKFFDGQDVSAPLIEARSGENTESIFASGNKIHISFVSSYETLEEFNATVKFVKQESCNTDKECGIICPKDYFVCGNTCKQNTTNMKRKYRSCGNLCLANNQQCNGSCPEEMFACGDECYSEEKILCGNSTCLIPWDYEYNYWSCGDFCLQKQEQCNGSCDLDYFKCGNTCYQNTSYYRDRYWECGDECIDRTTQCNGTCPVDHFTCGDYTCYPDTPHNRENYRSCDVNCISKTESCNNQCPEGLTKCCNLHYFYQCQNMSSSDYWQCNGLCLPKTDQCQGVCVSGYLLCGQECLENTTYNRESYRTCGDQCLYYPYQCQGECLSDYFVCGNECKKNTTYNKESYRTCGDQCLSDEYQCQGKCPDHKNFTCGDTKCYPHTSYYTENYKTCREECVSTSQECKATCPDGYFYFGNLCDENTPDNIEYYRNCGDNCISYIYQCNGSVDIMPDTVNHEDISNKTVHTALPLDVEIDNDEEKLHTRVGISTNITGLIIIAFKTKVTKKYYEVLSLRKRSGNHVTDLPQQNAWYLQYDKDKKVLEGYIFDEILPGDDKKLIQYEVYAARPSTTFTSTSTSLMISSTPPPPPPDLECCKTKVVKTLDGEGETVGTYDLVRMDETIQFQFQCENGCVYQLRGGDITDEFCFLPSSHVVTETECLLDP